VTPVHNAIVTSQLIDSGITRQRYVNTTGNFDYWFYGSYGIKIKKLDMYLGFNVNNNGGRYVNFVNGLKNSTRQSTNGIGFNLSKYKENKFEFNISSDFNYNKSQSSTQQVSYWSSSENANVTVYITKNFQIGTDGDLTLRQKTDAFTGNNNFFVWNANVNYKIFKKRNGVFKLEMNDILQQRRGYERTFSSNYVYERRYNTLGRYAMLSFTWNFTKNPGAPPVQNK
jgi:hypothetical protein